MGSRRNNRHRQQGPSSRKEALRQQDQSSNQIAPAPTSQPQAAQPEAKRGENKPAKSYERRIANWTVVVGALHDCYGNSNNR
jgi:hypothetical protein